VLRHACERHALRAQLSRRKRDLEEFSQAAAHDLRAPLRQINMFAQLLNDHLGASLDEKGSLYLGYLGQAAERLSALVENLLLLARFGNAALDLGPHPLDAVAREAIESMTTPEERSRIHLAPLPTLVIDKTLVRVLFENLVSNALRYGGESVQVWIDASVASSAVTVRVCDDGPGIAGDDKNHVLGAFERGPTSAGKPGTGLGLAICARAVERHGGRLWLEDNPNGPGLTVWFDLPDLTGG
jgi:signal transduction histidine kinase